MYKSERHRHYGGTGQSGINAFEHRLTLIYVYRHAKICVDEAYCIRTAVLACGSHGRYVRSIRRKLNYERVTRNLFYCFCDIGCIVWRYPICHTAIFYIRAGDIQLQSVNVNLIKKLCALHIVALTMPAKVDHNEVIALAHYRIFVCDE